MFFKGLSKSLDYLCKFNKILITLVIAAMVFGTSYNVFGRYVLGRSLRWISEFAAYGLIWITFLGAANAMRAKRHLGVDIFVKRFNEKARVFAYRFTLLLLLALFIIILRYGIVISLNTMHRSAITLPVRIGIIYSVLPYSAVIMGLITIEQFFDKDVDVMYGDIDETELSDVLDE